MKAEKYGLKLVTEDKKIKDKHPKAISINALVKTISNMQ